MFELLCTAAVCATDQKVKNYLDENMDLGENKSICHGCIKLCLHHNYGFSANMCAGKTILVKTLSVVLTLLVTILYIVTLGTTGKGLLRFSLSLILGGAFSNTYDRIKNGYVIDYVRLPFGSENIKKLVWNIADFAIIIGALISVLSAD